MNEVDWGKRQFTDDVVGHTRHCMDGMYLELWGGDIPSERSANRSVPLHPCGTLLQIQFLLTKLDRDFPAVLGLDWLTLHNPLIDWVRHSVTF